MGVPSNSCSEPFFNDSLGRISIRSWRANALTDPRDFLPPGDFRPVYNYVPAGEVYGLLALDKWFTKKRVEVHHRARLQDYEQVPKENLVLLGGPRRNALIKLLQADFHYFMSDDDWIDDVRDRKDGAHPFEDSHPQGAHNFQKCHALVTRSLAPDGIHSVTTISANQARVVRAACELLADEEAFKKVVGEVDVFGHQHFQLIFRTDVFGHETQNASLERVAAWADDPDAS